MEYNVKIVRNHQLIAKKIKNEFIVLDANRGRLYRLNETAQMIWSYSNKSRTMNEIIQKIIIEFSIEPKKAEKDVTQFINRYLNTLFFTVKK